MIVLDIIIALLLLFIVGIILFLVGYTFHISYFLLFIIALGIIILMSILSFIKWYISISNKIKKVLVKIDEADSGIDTALAKRYDVLTKMIDVVKAYTTYETDTLTKTIELRKNMTIKEKAKTNDKINKSLEQIKIVAENYPELKSNDNYIKLQETIVDVEEHLQAARRFYNSNISTYNQFIVTFPNSIVAKKESLSKKDFFEIDEIKKDDVKIDL